MFSFFRGMTPYDFVVNFCLGISLTRLKRSLFQIRMIGYSDNHSVPDVMCRSMLL
jgi:hypothetical protein